MSLFKINGFLVKRISTKELELEKNLQHLFEENLEEILNIVFLAHEYSTSFGGRIDTLGIDKNGAPCIIEYKKKRDDNVINQGLSYLRWLLDHQADFEALCHAKLSEDNKELAKEIDWNSPRVICIAESYNKFDTDTADIVPMNIELLRYRIYKEGILYLEPENYQKVRISTSKIIKNGKVRKEKESQLQKSYRIEDHLKNINKETLNLFQEFREKVISIDRNIVEEAKKKYIAYKISTNNFVDVVVKQYGLKVFLNIKTGQLNDPQKFARDLATPQPVGHWGNGDYELRLESLKNIDDVFVLIKQSYDLNK